MKPIHALVAGCLVAAPAFAQNDAKFRSLDRNGDGFITRDEVSHIQGYHRALAEADDNRDGRLDPTEFVKAESYYAREQATVYLNDGTLTAKVKAALLRERGIKSSDVHVESSKGIVLLSGWVDTEDQRVRAARVASLVDGVREVRNGLNVK